VEGGHREEAAVVVSADSAAGAAVSAAEAQDRVGSEMRTREFLSKLDHDRIVDSIGEVESNTSGEIRVYLKRGKLDADPLITAQKKFRQLRMDQTAERNAVLIFVAPRAHKFAVVGDKMIHEKCGGEFWRSIVERMRTHFKNEKFSDALVEAIKEIGKVLAGHFPKTSANPNELPDEIIEG
jgi:uncharacterized membrane protein